MLGLLLSATSVLKWSNIYLTRTVNHFLLQLSNHNDRIHHFLILYLHEISHKYNTVDDWEISATQRIYIRHPKSGEKTVTAVSVQSIVMKLLDLR